MAVRMIGKLGSGVSGSTVPAKDYYEGYCDSQDTKPVGNTYAEGSTLIETDTGDVYFYNERLGQWIRQFCLQNL